MDEPFEWKAAVSTKVMKRHKQTSDDRNCTVSRVGAKNWQLAPDILIEVYVCKKAIHGKEHIFSQSTNTIVLTWENVLLMLAGKRNRWTRDNIKSESPASCSSTNGFNRSIKYGIAKIGDVITVHAIYSCAIFVPNWVNLDRQNPWWMGY